MFQFVLWNCIQAERSYRRQAPLEQGRNGLMENHFTFYSSANSLLEANITLLCLIALSRLAIAYQWHLHR